MSLLEETIEATLGSDGQLQLSHASSVAPGPVKVTIRSVPASLSRLTMADVLREIMEAQRARGYFGRSAEEIQAEREEMLREDEEREARLEAARDSATQGGP